MVTMELYGFPLEYIMAAVDNQGDRHTSTHCRSATEQPYIDHALSTWSLWVASFKQEAERRRWWQGEFLLVCLLPCTVSSRHQRVEAFRGRRDGMERGVEE